MSSLQQSTNAFDALPIRQAVFRQTFPAIASQMITLIYNLADTYFVGMLNQPSQTAAITVVYSSFLMLTAISNLFGVGGASALARALGRKAPDEARRIASISFWFGLFSGALFCLLFWCFRQPILVLCGATQDTLPIALGYAQWVVVIGGPATILSTLFGQPGPGGGQGRGKPPSAFLWVGPPTWCWTRCFLPQFLGLGAVGAGMATCLSNVLSTLYFLVHLLRCQGETAVDLHPRHLPFIRKYGKDPGHRIPPPPCSMPLPWWRWPPSPGLSPATPPRRWRGLALSKSWISFPVFFHRRLQWSASPAGLPLCRRTAGKAPGRLPTGLYPLPGLCPALSCDL